MCTCDTEAIESSYETVSTAMKVTIAEALIVQSLKDDPPEQQVLEMAQLIEDMKESKTPGSKIHPALLRKCQSMAARSTTATAASSKPKKTWKLK